MPAITLYDFPLSGNCHKVRLLLSMLDLEYERVSIDVVAKQTASPEFKRINPRGQVPFLVDGQGNSEMRIWDSMAILIYLARRYGNSRWLPDDPAAEAVVMQWLAVAGDELLYGLARARAVWRLGAPFDREQCQQEGRAGLALMEQRLKQEDWLAADHPTIADLACYPYVALAGEAGVSLAPYPAVREWMARIESLPGHVPLIEQEDGSARKGATPPAAF
ncbi:glutathione S-transferase family protein [Guyparkeria halophila]|uniref:Glutathione S-transferase family protein n=1 Tax=Guyparkeria halophila TaxID=47960 RepID=A0ABZ0YYP3_9GAMM|nr:glutathione S-transferase family protein [Guyparkeria halophila]WQH17295.1 glutathione S-transferase family protein [Guyparkeria halophila]